MIAAKGQRFVNGGSGAYIRPMPRKPIEIPSAATRSFVRMRLVDVRQMFMQLKDHA